MIAALPTPTCPWFHEEAGLHVRVTDALRIKHRVQLRVELWTEAQDKIIESCFVTPSEGATMTTLLAKASEFGNADGLRDFLLLQDAAAGAALDATPYNQVVAEEHQEGEPEYSDTGNSDRFVAKCNGNIVFAIYRAEKGSWRRYTGTHWTDATMGDLMEIAKAVTRDMLETASTITDDRQRRKLYTHAIRSQSERAIKSMIALSQGRQDVQGRISDFDTHRYLLNVANGVLNLETGELTPHKREYFFTSCLATAYVPHAPCPLFHGYLDRFQPDATIQSYLQQIMGYTLTASTEMECIFFHFGGGSNGKSTFIKIFKEILGETACQARAESFMVKEGSGGINNDIAGFAGKRMICCTELDQGKRFSEALIKQCASTDTIRARFLHKEEFDYDPSYKLWFSGNHKPVIRGADDGIWDRVRLIPWEVRIDRDGPEVIRDYWRTLYETEAEGILAWAVQGCLGWAATRRLPAPPIVKAASAEYRSEMDAVGSFLSECVVDNPTGLLLKADLYTAFVGWAKDNNEFPMAKRVLSTRLVDRGWKDTHTRQGYAWKHWALAPGVAGHKSYAASNGYDPSVQLSEKETL